MKTILIAFLLLTMPHAARSETDLVPTVSRDGVLFARASDLAEKAGIAIKDLPGQKQMVACREERCALIKDFVQVDDEILVAVSALAEALSARTHVEAATQKVRFEFDREFQGTQESVARVGQLAPDFVLPTLDGRTIALSQLRGKRVLINSWASW